MVAYYNKTPVLESYFNSENCKIFKSTYFKEHLRTAASENVFKKVRKIRIYSKRVLILHLKKIFSTSTENVSFCFMIGFPQSLYSHTMSLVR